MFSSLTRNKQPARYVVHGDAIVVGKSAASFGQFDKVSHRFWCRGRSAFGGSAEGSLHEGKNSRAVRRRGRRGFLAGLFLRAYDREANRRGSTIPCHTIGKRKRLPRSTWSCCHWLQGIDRRCYSTVVPAPHSSANSVNIYHPVPPNEEFVVVYTFTRIYRARSHRAPCSLRGNVDAHAVAVTHGR